MAVSFGCQKRKGIAVRYLTPLQSRLEIVGTRT